MSTAASSALLGALLGSLPALRPSAGLAMVASGLFRVSDWDDDKG
jgi:hypothetical protein